MAIALVGILTFIVIRMVTSDNELQLVVNYTAPAFAQVDTLEGLSSSRYAIAVDGDIVYADSDEIYPTASTAKMILGLAIMQKKPFNLGEAGETITITDEYYNLYSWYLQNGGSTSAVAVGEEISQYNALASVFLPSSNNMADTLAIWAFGSLDNYREYATKMLSEWGIQQTTVGIDASGFDASTTSTTSDLAKIGARVLAQPVLAEIVGLKERAVPVAGVLHNTNQILGENQVAGIKTGYIGDASGYCLVSGYYLGDHIVTIALTGAKTRGDSFADSLAIVKSAQETLKETDLVQTGEVVGYYDSWWTGKIPIRATEKITGIGWDGAEAGADLAMTDQNGTLKIQLGHQNYSIAVAADEYVATPSLWQRFLHAFGYQKHTPDDENHTFEDLDDFDENNREENTSDATAENLTPENENHTTESEDNVATETLTPITNAPSNNCTIKYGKLMLINPNYTVDTNFISARRGEMISLSKTYGIPEMHSWNGDNLLDPEAAEHLATMLEDYRAAFPGHEMGTMSCFRSVGTSCGRLCAATGASDHHTGLTCDLIDTAYGSALNTDDYSQHPDWQWLRENSYKYGFIDRFPEAWAGGPMSEPLNVDENGSTGLFETWHYRYVGISAATEIATGKYNHGEYDSLEHYLKMRGLLKDLKLGTCE